MFLKWNLNFTKRDEQNNIIRIINNHDNNNLTKYITVPAMLPATKLYINVVD